MPGLAPTKDQMAFFVSEPNGQNGEPVRVADGPASSRRQLRRRVRHVVVRAVAERRAENR